MDQPRAGPRIPWPMMLAILLAVALALRIWAVGVEGHNGDVLIIHRWAERLAEVGPWGFYTGTLSVYPGLLYLYWPMGLLFDGEALDLAIKGSSIPFDLAIGVLLFVVLRRFGTWRALGASALYLLNPAVLLAGPMWGQIDAAGTLLLLLALVALAAPRWALAGALAVLAGMAKPQFGLVVLPVAWLAISAWRSGAGLAPVRRAVLGGLGAYLVVAGPLLLDPLRYADQLYEITRVKPYVSLFAPNPWGVLVGFEVPDDGLAGPGLALLGIGLALSLLPLRRRRDLLAVLASGLLIVFAFYFLPTRSHERYLFPAMALLAPFAVLGWRLLAAYLAMALAFAASLVFAMAHINPPAVPDGLREALLTPAAVWAMGLVLAGSAVGSIWLIAGRLAADD